MLALGEERDKGTERGCAEGRSTDSTRELMDESKASKCAESCESACGSSDIPALVCELLP